ncbi:hypothetical protein [Pseudomonas moorei]|uniref:hypothetical protein n=1 Tax=Pseudomonas moorei TaxID=395599 RepID=UPI00200CB143|nr:hypothetical protein [Pseudomonas moorei]
MKRLTRPLYMAIACSVIAHLAYTYIEGGEPDNLTYFASGIFLMSNGVNIPVATRTQYRDYGLYEYIQVGPWYLDTLRTTTVRYQDNMQLKTQTVDASPDHVAPHYEDEDIVYSMAYTRKVGVSQTFYDVTPKDLKEQKVMCFYIKELQKLRCFSRTRD